jgi:NDP-sugar pyrophosphorylase family protein
MFEKSRSKNLVKITEVGVVESYRALQKILDGPQYDEVQKISFVFEGKKRELERHRNHNGSIGGFVEKTASIGEFTCICEHAMVLEKATVKTLIIMDHALVYGNAQVIDGGTVYGGGVACGNAIISGGNLAGIAIISGNAMISGNNVHVYGEARIDGNARIRENARISGKTHISGDAEIFGNTDIEGDVEVSTGKIGIGFNFTTQSQIDEFLRQTTGLMEKLVALKTSEVLMKAELPKPR